MNALLLLVLTAVAGPPADLPVAIDWPRFLSRSDLVWDRAPPTWDRGAFLGNGQLGAMVYAPRPHALELELGRVDVADDFPQVGGVAGSPRLPIGEVVIDFPPGGTGRGALDEGPWRLDLWNATLDATLDTTTRPTRLRAFVHATLPILAITAEGERARDLRVAVRPALALDDRTRSREPLLAARLPEGPTVEDVGDVHVIVQRHVSGGAHAVAWTDTKRGGRRTVLLTVAQGAEPGVARRTAVSSLQKAAQTGLPALRTSHERWWHDYYPASFVSLPDARVESFYWIQIYKLAAATRGDGPALDTLGPWYHRTPWPGVWWNLNLQLSYWPVYTANRLALGDSLLNLLRRNRDQLNRNVPEALRGQAAAVGRTSGQQARSAVEELDGADRPGRPHELSNLIWALHDAWLHQRHAMDQDLLRTLVHPLLARAVAYSVSRLASGPDGKLHLPVAVSPEYPRPAPDTNYDLSLLRWGLETLLANSRELGVDEDERPRWERTLQELAPYPEGPDGFHIGRGVPLTESHRHFSHLLMVYPLGLLDPADAGHRARIERSLAHWIGFEGALQGYSFVGASAMSSLLGKGDDALGFLHQLLRRFVRRNTMYTEAGPVIETPLSAAQAVHEMLIAGRRGVVHVFPALPQAWKDVTFHRLRTEGAFLVSAVRRGGRTTAVRVESLAGAPCRLRLPMEHPRVLTPSEVTLPRAPDGTHRLDMAKGQSVVIVDGDSGASPVAPVSLPDSQLNPWGARTRWPIGTPAAVPQNPGPSGLEGPAGIDGTGAITRWLWLGPVPLEHADNGWEEIDRPGPDGRDEGTWLPAAGQGIDAATNGHRWRLFESDGGVADLAQAAKPGPSTQVVGWAATYLHVGRALDGVELSVGSSDQVKLWLDGRVIHTHRTPRAFRPDEDTVPLPRLSPGWHLLLAKVINESGGWKLGVRLTGAPDLAALKALPR